MKRELAFAGLIVLVSGLVFCQEAPPPVNPVPTAAETPAPPPTPAADQTVPATAQPASAPKDWSIAPYLPSETVLVISLKDVAKAREGFAKTGLAQLINSPELTDVFKGPLLLAKGALWMAEQKHGYKLNDILNSFQGEVSIALMGLQETRNEKGEKIPDLLVAFQPRGRAAKTMELINKFIDDLNKQAMGQLLIQQSTFAGAQINTLSLPENPLRLCYTLHNGMFLATLSPGRLESILSRYQAEVVEKQKAEGLGANPIFQRTWAKVGQNADAVAFFNLEAARKIPDMNLQPKTEKDRRGLEAAGLDKVRALTYSLTFKDQDIHESLFVDCPTEDRHGLMAMLDNPPISPDALTSMPQNAVFASAWKTDLVKFLDRVIELAGAGNPGDAELIENEIRKLNDELKIDFRQDLLAAFDGQVLFSLAFPSKNPKLGFGFPAPIIRLGVKDKSAAEKALGILRQMGQDAFNFIELPAGDNLIVIARAKKRQPDDPGQICWTLTDKHVLMSIYPLALRDELQRMAGTKPGVGSNLPATNLTMDPQFQNIRSRLGETHQMLVYMDVSALATAFYDIYIPLAQLNPKIAPNNVDLNTLPTSDFLTRHLGGLVVGINADPEGLVLESCSATGFWTTVTPMVVIAARAAERHRRAQAAAAGPDGAPEQARNRQLMRELNTRLMAYAQDHDQAYPAKLAELVPNYATEEELRQTANVEYRGKQEAPNRIVAHSPTDAGRTIVLLQDGRVRTIAADQLAAALEQGFTEPPRPEPTGERPPVPPPDF